jgi:hypothetical protein
MPNDLPPPIPETSNDAGTAVGFVADHLELFKKVVEKMPADYEIDAGDLGGDLGGIFVVGPDAACAPPIPLGDQPIWRRCSWVPLGHETNVLYPADIVRLIERILEVCEAVKHVLGGPPPVD